MLHSLDHRLRDRPSTPPAPWYLVRLSDGTVRFLPPIIAGVAVTLLILRYGPDGYMFKLTLVVLSLPPFLLWSWSKMRRHIWSMSDAPLWEIRLCRGILTTLGVALWSLTAFSIGLFLYVVPMLSIDAAHDGRLRDLRLLVSLHVPQSIPGGLSPALASAAGSGRLDCMAYLIDHGADVNGARPMGRLEKWYFGTEWRYPPIFDAVIGNHPDAVSLLLNHGVSTEVRGRHGVTPLIVAARTGSASCTNLLIKRHANLDAVDTAGRSALWYALWRHKATAPLLQKAGAKDISPR